MNAIQILKKDHKKLIDLMDKIEVSAQNSHKDLDKLFTEFKKEFSLHDESEDNIVYPTFIKHKELKPLILKGYQAHHVVEVGILELRLLPFNSESWLPKFLVIKDSILTHAKEEEKLLFPTASKVINEQTLIKLGKTIADSRS
jgi:hemerythrin superfamily protein